MHVDFISLCNLIKACILEQFFVTLRKWCICLNHDTMFLAEVSGVLVEVERMSLDLIDDWFHV